jgi:hypothetical protein
MLINKYKNLVAFLWEVVTVLYLGPSEERGGFII